MNRIGCLGDIAFTVSDKTIKTIRGAVWSGSANMQTHDRHLLPSLVEFTGVNPDSFTFSLRLAKQLGTNPVTDISRLLAYERNGIAVPLIIGNSVIGTYRWLVEKHKITFENYDRGGTLITADVSVTLTEYTRR